MKLAFLAALAASTLLVSPASAAVTYDFVVAPILDSNGRPVADDNGRIDGRTFVFSIGADETPTQVTLSNPSYFAKSYTWYEFGSTDPVVIPGVSGRNINFFSYIQQGGLSFISGTRNFRLLGDTVNNDSSEVLYDEAAYVAAKALDPYAQPIFKLGTFTLSTYPRNGLPRQPIQNYTVTISQAAAAVPEPATWAMMIGGIGTAGGALRRRQRVAVRFA